MDILSNFSSEMNCCQVPSLVLSKVLFFIPNNSESGTLKYIVNHPAHLYASSPSVSACLYALPRDSVAMIQRSVNS